MFLTCFDLGAGADFALEDVFVLTRAISWAHDRGATLGEALQLFDSVRSPHYRRLVGADSNCLTHMLIRAFEVRHSGEVCVDRCKPSWPGPTSHI